MLVNLLQMFSIVVYYNTHLVWLLPLSFRYLTVIRLHHHLVYQNPIPSSPSVHPITVQGLLLKGQEQSHSHYSQTIFATPTLYQVGFLLFPALHRHPVIGLQLQNHRASSHQVCNYLVLVIRLIEIERLNGIYFGWYTSVLFPFNSLF